MTTLSPVAVPTVRERVISMLDPRSFRGPSMRWVALVGYILEQEYTTPQIISLVVTSDDVVLVGTTRDPLHNEMIGALSDLQQNWREYCAAAGLDSELQAEADRMFKEKVGREP